jgi:predicted aspartyl protease
MSTKIRLYWQTSYDSRHLADGIHVRNIRLYTQVSFRKPDGWSYPFIALIDTGSQVIVIPEYIWREIHINEYLSEKVELGGIGKGTLMARLARIEMAFLSTRKEVVELPVKAYLADNDSVPLLLGIEDLLTKARLVCDYPKDKAFLQFA